MPPVTPLRVNAPATAVRRKPLRVGGLLMDGGEPAGGRWNFDADNGEPAPKKADALDAPAP